ncbi:hypothetical protein KBD59_02185 [Candidatus Gracilibacteria bacterium]|nr:hypothetical protein [Candidatus Gracilibacteria bacterium]
MAGPSEGPQQREPILSVEGMSPQQMYDEMVRQLEAYVTLVGIHAQNGRELDLPDASKIVAIDAPVVKGLRIVFPRSREMGGVAGHVAALQVLWNNQQNAIYLSPMADGGKGGFRVAKTPDNNEASTVITKQAASIPAQADRATRTLSKIAKPLNGLLIRIQDALDAKEAAAAFSGSNETGVKEPDPELIEQLRSSVPPSAVEVPAIDPVAIAPIIERTAFMAKLGVEGERGEAPPPADIITTVNQPAIVPDAAGAAADIGDEADEGFPAELTPTPAIDIPPFDQLPMPTGSFDGTVLALSMSGRLDAQMVAELEQLLAYFSDIEGHPMSEIVPAHAPEIAAAFIREIAGEGPEATIKNLLGRLIKTRPGEAKSGVNVGFPKRPRLARVTNDKGMIRARFLSNSPLSSLSPTAAQKDERWLTIGGAGGKLVDEVHYGVDRGKDGNEVPKAVIALMGKSKPDDVFPKALKRLVLDTDANAALPSQEDVRAFSLMWRLLRDGLRGEFALRRTLPAPTTKAE